MVCPALLSTETATLFLYTVDICQFCSHKNVSSKPSMTTFTACIVCVAGGMTHWEVGKQVSPLGHADAWKRPYHQAGASDIEITAYALLAYNTNNDIIGGIPIIKWLASQRNPGGGFASTQVRGHCKSLSFFTYLFYIFTFF